MEYLMMRNYTDIGHTECRRNMAWYAVLRGYDTASYNLGMPMRLFTSRRVRSVTKKQWGRW